MMMAPVKRKISATCPECASVRLIDPTELKRIMSCRGCGTGFYVVRHRVRHRVPRSAWLARLDGAGSGRHTLDSGDNLDAALKVLLLMALVVMAVLLLIHLS